MILQLKPSFEFFNVAFSTATRFTSIGPIYYEYGSMVITYDNSDSAVQAYDLLRTSKYEDKKLLGKIYKATRSNTRHLILSI